MAEKRLVKAAKLRETRKLRHTMGRRQKEKIKATGPVVVSVSFDHAAPVAPLRSSSRPGLDLLPGTGTSTRARDETTGS
ncbi:hypothetical protein HY251_13170 [bacterium]|nr:hypothetical protein [bacterium]